MRSLLAPGKGFLDAARWVTLASEKACSVYRCSLSFCSYTFDTQTNLHDAQAPPDCFVLLRELLSPAVTNSIYSFACWYSLTRHNCAWLEHS